MNSNVGIRRYDAERAEERGRPSIVSSSSSYTFRPFSPSRRMFCLICAFDFLLTLLMWIIYVHVSMNDWIFLAAENCEVLPLEECDLSCDLCPVWARFPYWAVLSNVNTTMKTEEQCFWLGLGLRFVLVNA